MISHRKEFLMHLDKLREVTSVDVADPTLQNVMNNIQIGFRDVQFLTFWIYEFSLMQLL